MAFQDNYFKKPEDENEAALKLGEDYGESDKYHIKNTLLGFDGPDSLGDLEEEITGP